MSHGKARAIRPQSSPGSRELRYLPQPTWNNVTQSAKSAISLSLPGMS